MGKVNYYRIAPTHLYNKDGESQLFKTQDEVDQAWEDGWFGPPWLLRKGKPISQIEFKNKGELCDAVSSDPRYEGLNVNPKMGVPELEKAVLDFEVENGLLETEEE